MKRIIILLALILSFTLVMGQELTVKNFALDPTDLTASTQRRNDLNGDACALIKVQLARPGAEFLGNVMGDTPYNKSEYFVYMMKGSKMLQVKLEGYLPEKVNFTDYGFSGVESLSTYVLSITLPGGTQPELDTQYFTLTVTPKNASILLDGGLVSLDNDGVYSQRLKLGRHNYEIAAQGYAVEKGSFILRAGESQRLDLSVTLVSAKATLLVTCATADADIYINDEKKEKTHKGWNGSLDPGNYLIEARKEGYITQKRSVTLSNNQNLKVELPALVASTGLLDINYKPIRAEVLIDGEKKGTSPNLFSNLAVGNHRVEIRKEGYRSETMTVTIEEGQTTSLSGNLTEYILTTTKATNGSALGSSSIASTSSTDSSTSVVAYKQCPDNHHPHLIDLGLPSGTKWACCNVGAEMPEECGGYYAWGETESKEKYNWKTYKYALIGKKCKNIGDDIAGTKYDVAQVKWGGAWKMPTPEQFEELKDECTLYWTNQNGVNGFLATGANGGRVFLPAAGYRQEETLKDKELNGRYFTSSATPNINFDSYYIGFDSLRWSLSIFGWRSEGFSVRPVFWDKQEEYASEKGYENYHPREDMTSQSDDIEPTLSFKTCPDDHHPHMIDLGLPSGTKWACCNVDAKNPEDDGGYYCWGETETKEEYGWSNYIHCDGNELSCHHIGNDIAGTQYDVAHLKMGGAWQMPTLEQIKELFEHCIKLWTSKNGVYGFYVTGPNGGKIFLPAAGYRSSSYRYEHGSQINYWSSAINRSENTAYAIDFDDILLGHDDRWYSDKRRVLAFPVRAVCQ